ncbi:thioredoxin family protein [Mycoplasma nasistruthionis]|uniref:Thioredoxin n=1 Tax=Mycoplasma nasistruthionis TaxID=353852 RepID=A0A5B7XWI4_9MOLU|nr:thioredoxin family protein [Mycoplasma nasistruthionis]QCZ36950.1 thioredoxin family protein [Mycoplasma nasistruthionis]
MLHETTKELLQEKLNDGTVGKRLLVFYADWCGPCKMYKSSLEQLVEKDNMDVFRVNIDKEQELAKEYRVASIPFTVVLENNQATKSFAGFKPYELLKNEI